VTDLSPPLGELLRPDDPVAFVAVIELMDSLGVRFVVEPPDGLGQIGPQLPDWCADVIGAWFDFVVRAFVGHASGHRAYCCTACCFPMLMPAERKGRRCPACGAVKAMTHRLPIRFVNPPRRTKEAS
jgi:hypothetical protein